MKQKIKKSLTVFLLSLFIPGVLIAQSLIPERRTLKTKDEFGWLIAPMPIIIPGIGTAYPILSILSNVYKSTDVMLAQTTFGGDFTLRFGMVDQLPLLTEHVLLTYGQWSNKIAFKQFRRGIDSDKDEFFQPVSEQVGAFSQLRLTFWKKRLEFFTRVMSNRYQVVEAYDSEGDKMLFDDSVHKNESYFFGGIADFTDDHTDPRQGFRFGYRRNPVDNEADDQSDFYIQDVNLTYYLPIQESDSLVFNIFRSEATVTNRKTTNRAHFEKTICRGTLCNDLQNNLVDDAVAANRYGTATAIGGHNRLRSYPVGRFSAGNSATYGIEYRKNFSTQEMPVNWYFLGGIKTNLQASVFIEYGTVNDEASKLTSNLKPSYGIGIRTLISGLIYRFDLAYGDEGVAPVLFVFYPWDLNPGGGG